LPPTPRRPRLALILVDFLLGKQGIFKQASSAAQTGVSALPDSPEFMDALGRTQQLTGRIESGNFYVHKLAAMQPQSPQAQLRIADLHMAAKNAEGSGTKPAQGT